jgi:hypothetical protein
MTGSDADRGLEGRDRLDYFMVRLARRDRDPERVAGLVERLAMGQGAAVGHVSG